ncbi:MAG: hypothetical protein HY815_32985 [Candidatus Riflebacteria bacterium]|nr:hypothetical protein [Candidatus Riflebacteria bacterium]
MSRRQPGLRWAARCLSSLVWATVLSTGLTGGSPVLTVAYDIPEGPALHQLKGLAQAAEQTEVDRWGPSFFRILDDGRLVVGDPLAGRIKLFGPGNKVQAALGDPKHVLCAAIGELCLAPNREIVYVESSTRVLVRMDLEGKVKKVFDPRTTLAFEDPSRLESTRDGRLVVGDEGAGKIHVLDPELRLLKTIPYSGMGLALGPGDEIFTVSLEGRGYRIECWDRKLAGCRKLGLVTELPDAALHLETATPGAELVFTQSHKGGKGTRIVKVSPDGRVIDAWSVAGSRYRVTVRMGPAATLYALLAPAPAVPGSRYRIVRIAQDRGTTRLTIPPGSPAPPGLSREASKPGGPLLRTDPPGPPRAVPEPGPSAR